MKKERKRRASYERKKEKHGLHSSQKIRLVSKRGGTARAGRRRSRGGASAPGRASRRARQASATTWRRRSQWRSRPVSIAQDVSRKGPNARGRETLRLRAALACERRDKSLGVCGESLPTVETPLNFWKRDSESKVKAKGRYTYSPIVRG